MTAVEENRLLSYTFGEGNMDWTITWRLAHAFTTMSGGGWAKLLPHLARTLEETPV